MILLQNYNMGVGLSSIQSITVEDYLLLLFKQMLSLTGFSVAFPVTESESNTEPLGRDKLPN